LNGKKRFFTSAGTASRYLVYAKTSDNPEDVRSHKHLTAFLAEKGSANFSVEKINEIVEFDNSTFTKNRSDTWLYKYHLFGLIENTSIRY